MLTVALLAVLVFVSVVVRVADRVQWCRPADEAPGTPDPSPATTGLRRVQARIARRGQLPLLPEGHRPPSGLGPLSPSERFLSSEAARGIRALQLWLLDQDGAAA